MKSHVDYVDLSLYAALFKDVAAWDDGLRDALTRDLTRIETLTASRGLSFVMIDMPQACKVVDQALATGEYDPEDLPETFGKVDRGHRVFLRCLFKIVFCQDGSEIRTADPTTVYFLRQILLLAKKVRKNCDEAAIQAEVESFALVDRQCRNHTLDWDLDLLYNGDHCRLSFGDGYRSEPDLVSQKDECSRGIISTLDRVAGTLSSGFPELDWREIEPRHGPGSVADAKTGEDKYQFPNWPEKLEGTFPFAYFGQSREDLHLERSIPTASPHEPPARLIAVPKTLKGPRMIASEPTAHQFLQLGLMKWIRDNMPGPLRACIHFTSQAPNQKLCLEASANGEYATVDLSAASDRLSCWVVERAFEVNPPLLRALHACRTRWLVNATGVGEKYFLKLRKFAAMGSGTTFPVQTIVYAYCAIAAILWTEGRKVTYRSIRSAAGKCRVFGDDVILPSSAVPSLTSLFAYLGLQVNKAKTHSTGYFRESCGVDAYRGEDISPLYLRALGLDATSAEELVSWVDVTNNAYTKGLWALSDYLASQIPEKVRRLLPVTNQSLSCLTLFTYGAPRVGKVRNHLTLHRPEVRGLVPLSKALTRQRANHLNLLQYFVEKPSPDTNWCAGYAVGSSLQIRKGWSPLF